MFILYILFIYLASSGQCCYLTTPVLWFSLELGLLSGWVSFRSSGFLATSNNPAGRLPGHPKIVCRVPYGLASFFMVCACLAPSVPRIGPLPSAPKIGPLPSAPKIGHLPIVPRIGPSSSDPRIGPTRVAQVKPGRMHLSLCFTCAWILTA